MKEELSSKIRSEVENDHNVELKKKRKKLPSAKEFSRIEYKSKTRLNARTRKLKS